MLYSIEVNHNKMSKVTFIATVLNEENTITKLLDSLSNQTKKVNEIIIVDAGSTDKTVFAINQFTKIKSVILVKKKGNRSVGRNFAIKKATGEIIVASDAGCILKSDWVEKITEPFKDRAVDVVAGYYKPIVKNIFQKSLATYTSVMPDRVTSDFLPSSRSIAFRKNAWQKIGGYPENLSTCEDLVFARNLKRTGFKFKVEKKAIVNWPQRETLLQAFLQFFSYAKGDGKAGYLRRQTPLLFLRCVIGGLLIAIAIYKNSLLLLLLCLFLFFLYCLWSVGKNYRYVKSTSAFVYLPLLQILSDIAVFFGMTIGFFQQDEKR